MRKKWINEQRIIYGKSIEKPLAKLVKPVKFKLVEDPVIDMAGNNLV